MTIEFARAPQNVTGQIIQYPGIVHLRIACSSENVNANLIARVSRAKTTLTVATEMAMYLGIFDDGTPLLVGERGALQV